MNIAAESIETVSHSRVQRVHLFGVDIDAVTMSQSVQRILGWIDHPAHCRFVVTPNVDHIVLLRECNELQRAYRSASLVLADGWPVVAASRLLGQSLPQRVAGSDLVPRLLEATRDRRTLRLFLLGAGPGVAERAAERVHQQWSHAQVAGTYSPPLGFERDEQENDRIVEMVNRSASDLLVIGLGAPKQELWVARHQRRLKVPVALCVGATIDFLAGHRRRAPRWMQRCGLEWLHRVCSEPRRLARRYARDAVIFPRLVWQEAWRRGLRRTFR